MAKEVLPPPHSREGEKRKYGLSADGEGNQLRLFFTRSRRNFSLHDRSSRNAVTYLPGNFASPKSLGPAMRIELFRAACENPPLSLSLSLSRPFFFASTILLVFPRGRNRIESNPPAFETQCAGPTFRKVERSAFCTNVRSK